jgi:hypothetical protein
MNEQQLAAVKQALEALEIVRPMETPEPAVEEAIADLQSIISQDALHKMAEESRTSGLRLDDWDKIGCVNHDCDKCKAVQEPIGYFTVNGYDMWEQIDDTGGKPLYEHAAPQPVPVKTYHDGKPWPVAPKPWVGLDEDEVEDCARGCANHAELARAIEAKLKEKNT